MPLKRHEIISVFSKGSMGHYSLLKEKRMVYNPQGVIKDGVGTISESKHGKLIGKRPNQVGKVYKKQKNFPTSILTFNNPNNNLFHPTQKPVPLLEYLIRTYTNEGETVLDNCMGSGSTGVACANTNRDFIGIELDEHYFDIAKKRIQDALSGN